MFRQQFPASLLFHNHNQSSWSFNYITPRLMSSTEMIESTNGIITKAESLHYKTYQPVKGGLFCEKIFDSPTHDEESWLVAHQDRLRYFSMP